MDATAVLDLLSLARAFVEAGHTKRAQARDEEGVRVDPCAPAAVQFCAEGALIRAAFELGCPTALCDAARGMVLDTLGWGPRPATLHFANDGYSGSTVNTTPTILDLFAATAEKVGKS